MSILVLSGGGLNGLYILGALSCMAYEKYKCYIGTSIGSIINLLLSVGYSPQEIFEYTKSRYSDWFRVNVSKIFTDYGLCTFDQCEYDIVSMVKNKIDEFDENTTLQQMYDMIKKRYIVVTTCIETQSVVYISNDNHPDLSVVKAIRMSCAIPIIFSPITHNGHTYIDGGVSDNIAYKYAKTLPHDHIDVLSVYQSVKTHTNYNEYIWNILNIFTNIQVNNIKISQGDNMYTIKTSDNSKCIYDDVNDNDMTEMYLEGIKQYNEQSKD